MTLDAKSARMIGKEMAKVLLRSTATFLRLNEASALFGPSVSVLNSAITETGTARLRVMRRKRSDGKGRMLIVRRDEMERWVADNFEEVPENQKTPASELTGV